MDQGVEAALEALRDLWRDNLSVSRLAVAKAESKIRALASWATSAATAEAVREIEGRLGAYRHMDEADRAEELKRLAARIKALRPELKVGVAPAQPVGVLDGAIAATRVGAREPKPRRRTDPAVPPLKPDDPIAMLPGVGPSVAKKLATHKHTLETVGDLLALPPLRHLDFSRTVPISHAIREVHQEFGRPSGIEVTIRGQITHLETLANAKPPRTVAKISDGSGWVKVTWFSAFVGRQLALGDEIVVAGELKHEFGSPGFTNPEWELADKAGLSTGRLVPVYPLTRGVTQKTLRNLTRHALDATRNQLYDPLPPEIRQRFGLLPLWDAYEAIHYPATYDENVAGRRRLAFDDLYFLQLGYLLRRRDRESAGGIPLRVDAEVMDTFLNGLPFRLTGAQQRVLAEISADLAKPVPMARLLQGDVGSGKTVLAAAAALIATTNGYQAAVMAPTEILAEQHYHNLRGLFSGLPEAERPRVALLTGSTKAKERRQTLAAVQSGVVDVLVGTHALIQSQVEFDKLAVAVVDEQHRFGVRQRGELSEKGTTAPPHVLAMTATPIPRTLNLVLHGDLEVSVLDERPPGRIPIETRRYIGNERELAYELIRDQVDLGHQVFVICPLVEESEAIEAKAATEEAERLQREVFPELRIALLHGRMSAKQKDEVMTAFRDHEYDILVSTSVIEVGIDVPNATVMMIEGADRFGLAQLHQFRGRVGRGGHRSYCLLLADEVSRESDERLQTMIETDDGFVLAQRDLELRGPGDFLGTRQSGLPELSWLTEGFDTRVLDEARRAAEATLTEDPDLSLPKHQALKAELNHFWERSGVGFAP